METPNINLLELLSEKHTIWIKMVKSLMKGYKISPDIVEDIVQDMYLRLSKYVKDPERIMFGDEINTMFVYVTLRNLLSTYIKENKQYNFILIGSEFELNADEEINYELNDQYLLQLKLEKEILNEINSWHHYDSTLFKIIYYKDVSMRQLSRDTKISLSSIHNTTKKCRAILKEKFNKDFKDLKI